MSIQMGEIPDQGLLGRYNLVKHAYTDCFKTEVDQSVSFEKYARAFFSSPVFKLERIIIALTTGKEHGAFFTPLDEWILPLKQWIISKGQTD